MRGIGKQKNQNRGAKTAGKIAWYSIWKSLYSEDLEHSSYNKNAQQQPSKRLLLLYGEAFFVL
ncbi:hypothetical protein [Neobacillus fumarioli]|uniref:hypothetical protein n=1 Tax=Neobacillus fumarioli TaxID=105229 RepID=UPI000834BA4D|nr:hypothetical protein [Neobacillus fumarioli]